MKLKFKVGDTVAQVVKPIVGKVVEQRIISDTVVYGVEYETEVDVDGDGTMEKVTRVAWLPEAGIEAGVEAKAPEQA